VSTRLNPGPSWERFERLQRKHVPRGSTRTLRRLSLPALDTAKPELLAKLKAHGFDAVGAATWALTCGQIWHKAGQEDLVVHLLPEDLPYPTFLDALRDAEALEEALQRKPLKGGLATWLLGALHWAKAVRAYHRGEDAR
jgi:hypothetical protein